jgi:hypothetical protein
MNMDQASGPRMPRIKKLVFRDPVGVPSSCCTIASERIMLDAEHIIRGRLTGFLDTESKLSRKVA